MSDETIIKIETPESIPVVETPVITEPIVEPVIDMAVKLGEVCAKMELIETALAVSVSENAELKEAIKYQLEELIKLKSLMESPPEPDPIVEETPESELPVETLSEIEIIPEAVPEVLEEVKKRKRFFV